MTFFGPDVSKFQQEYVDGDGYLDLDDGDAWVDFLIARCVHENGSEDATYQPFRDYAKTHNLPFAAYTFLTDNPLLRQHIGTDNVVTDDIPIMCDWEKLSCTFDEMCAWVEIMRARGNRVPLLYTGRYFWQKQGSPTLAGMGMELVIARYGDQRSTGLYDPHIRYTHMVTKYADTWDWNLGGLTPVMWQYGSRILWNGLPIDFNAARDGAVIDRCFKQWQPPAPDPLPNPQEDQPMILVAKEPDGGAWWVSPNGGISRLNATSQHGKEWLDLGLFGPAIDVAGRQLVSRWGSVTQTLPLADIERLLGPVAR